MEEKKQSKPAYYAIIPASVRYADIKASAKLLYGELSALSNDKGYCWAANQYFAGLYKVTPKQVSLWVKELSDAGFIKVFFETAPQGTLRKIYIQEVHTPKATPKGLPIGVRGHQKVIEGSPKGYASYSSEGSPKGLPNNTLNNTYNKELELKGTKEQRSTVSPAKEKLRQAVQAGDYSYYKHKPAGLR